VVSFVKTGDLGGFSWSLVFVWIFMLIHLWWVLSFLESFSVTWSRTHVVVICGLLVGCLFFGVDFLSVLFYGERPAFG